MFTVIKTKLRGNKFQPSQCAQALFGSHRLYIPAAQIEHGDQLQGQFSVPHKEIGT